MTLLSSVWRLLLWDIRNDYSILSQVSTLAKWTRSMYYFTELVKNEISFSRERQTDRQNVLYLHVLYQIYSKCLLTILTTKQVELLQSRVCGQTPQDTALICDQPQRSNLASWEVRKLLPTCHNRKQKAYHQHDLDTCHFSTKKPRTYNKSVLLNYIYSKPD